LAAFYRKIKVGHVEAGLRTEDKYNPFPEEINRRLISHLADLHFAPTQRARENLLREGLNRRAISVTGNTVVDALKMILKKTEESGLREKLKVKMGEIKKIKAESKTGEKSGTAMSRARKPGRRGSKETASWLEAILERGRPTGPKSAPAARSIASSVSQTAAAGVRPTKLILVTAHRRESLVKGWKEFARP